MSQESHSPRKARTAGHPATWPVFSKMCSESSNRVLNYIVKEEASYIQVSLENVGLTEINIIILCKVP